MYMLRCQLHNLIDKQQKIKLYVPVVTLSTQDNTNLSQELKTGFQRIFNWNKYTSQVE